MAIRTVPPHVLWPCLIAAAVALVCGCGRRDGQDGVGRSARRTAPRPGATGPLPVITTPGGVEMLSVPAGTFTMGTRGGRPEESPDHEVRLSAFLMDRYEVIQEHFARLELPDPSHFKNPKHPVDQANWTDAARFCNERSRAEGFKPCYDETTWSCDFTADGYRLPTEAEWEYACRAGTSTHYSCGDAARSLSAYGWFADNAAGRTHPVGRKLPNPWGFHDLHGNVAEWCQDGFDKGYYRNRPQDDPHGPEAAGPERVVRGGSWRADAEKCRSASRAGDRSVLDTCLASDALGFRCVRRAPATDLPPGSARGAP